MKKTLIISLIMILFVTALASQTITEKQNEENRIYLSALDKNVLNTIELLEAFKTGKKEMKKKKYDNLQYYEKFLEDVSSECFLIRDNVFTSLNMPPQERSQIIKNVLKSLKPDVVFQDKKISQKQDAENRQYLEEISAKLVKKVNNTLQKITKEEEIIEEKEAITRDYLKLHSQHFMYSTLLNYIMPSEHLNKRYRNYLTRIVKEIMTGMQES